MATKSTDDTQQYVVLHTAVEGYYAGQVITLKHLQMGWDRPIDLDRLLKLGAIAPVDSDAGKEALDKVEKGQVTPTGDSVASSVPEPDTRIDDNKAAQA